MLCQVGLQLAGGSDEEVKNVKSLQMDEGSDGRRTKSDQKSSLNFSSFDELKRTSKYKSL